MDRQTLTTAGAKMHKITDEKPSGLHLWGEFMSGDADAYQKCFMEVESLEELYAILRYLKFKDAMNHNAEIDYRCRSKSEKLEEDFYEVAGEQWKEKYLWDAVTDWWPYDRMSGDCHASLQSYWVRFVDDTGEYQVEFPAQEAK